MIELSTNITAAKQTRPVQGQLNAKGFTPEDYRTNAGEGAVFDPDKLHLPASTVLVLKDCGDMLERYYPGWGWALQPNIVGQVINLFSLRCHPKWGVIMHMDKVSEVDTRKVWLPLYAGEILERFGLPRVPFKKAVDVYLDRPKDFEGNLIPDVAGCVTKLTKNQKIEIKIREGGARIIDLPDGRRMLRVGGGHV